MEAIFNTVFTTLGGILPNMSIPFKVGIIGGVLMLIVFLISLLILTGCKIDKYRKKLIATNRILLSNKPITEENVEVVYKEIQKHPEAVRSGWSSFLDQRVGAPSDYFPSTIVLASRDYSGKHTAGKSFMVILGAVIWALFAYIGYYYYTVTDTVFLTTNTTTAVGIIMALEFIIIPVALYAIFLLSIDIVLVKKYNRLAMAYTSFCEVVDDVVVVNDKEEESFVTNNLTEINKRVQELLALRRENKEEEVVEIITAPKAIETEEVKEQKVEVAEPVEEEIPLEPVIREEIAAMVPENPDEGWVAAILMIVDQALSDNTVPPEDYDTLGQLLDVAKSRLSDEELKEALDNSLHALADKFFSLVA